MSSLNRQHIKIGIGFCFLTVHCIILKPKHIYTQNITLFASFLYYSMVVEGVISVCRHMYDYCRLEQAKINVNKAKEEKPQR